MPLLKRIAVGVLGRWLDVGRFPSVEILHVMADGMGVRLYAPSSRYRLVSLGGDEEPLRRVGVRAPDGWRIDRGRTGGIPRLDLHPPTPLRMPPPGLDLRIPYSDPTAPPARLSVRMEARHTVGGGMSFVGFPVGGLHPVEIEAYNRRSALLREAQTQGIPWGSLPGADEVRELDRRARELRESGRAAWRHDSGPPTP